MATIMVTLTDDEAEALTNLVWRTIEPSDDYKYLDLRALRSASAKLVDAMWYDDDQTPRTVALSRWCDYRDYRLRCSAFSCPLAVRIRRL